jgi:hypothetical protein
MEEIENTLQMIMNGTDHELMDEIENMIIIDRTEGGRGRARQDHLVHL